MAQNIAENQHSIYFVRNIPKNMRLRVRGCLNSIQVSTEWMEDYGF